MKKHLTLENCLLYESSDKLAADLVKNILSVARRSIKSRNSFKLVLAGGSSLLKTYELLKNSNSDWSKWHVYISDERCLPLKHKYRNDNAINLAWLDHSPILEKNINFIPAELGTEIGAVEYEKKLNKVGYFDLVILGMGEDGHTASLFPGHSYDNRSVVIEKNSPKYPANRISMSYSRLSKTHNVFKVVVGSAKKDILDLWFAGAVLPINKINCELEKVFIHL